MMQKKEHINPCDVCKGYGKIWVNQYPNPVTCGHCGGTGRNQVLIK